MKQSHRRILIGSLLLLAILGLAVPGARAQSPVVTYVPQPAGLFGLQTVYRPVITYPSATVVHSAPVTAYRWPAPAVLPPPPMTVAYPALRPPGRVVARYAPRVAMAPVVTHDAPAPHPRPVVTYSLPGPVLLPYAPAPVAGPAPIVTQYPPVVVGP